MTATFFFHLQQIGVGCCWLLVRVGLGLGPHDCGGGLGRDRMLRMDWVGIGLGPHDVGDGLGRDRMLGGDLRMVLGGGFGWWFGWFGIRSALGGGKWPICGGGEGESG